MLEDVKLPFCTEPVLQYYGFFLPDSPRKLKKKQTWLTRAVPLSSFYSFCCSNSNSTDVSCSIKLFLHAKIILFPVLLLTVWQQDSCSAWVEKRAADFASHSYFLMGSALMVNCPWLNQLLPFPLTSFLLVYFIVHFAQCRTHSFSWHFIQFAHFSPWRGRHCRCFQVEDPSDDAGTSPKVFRVPILRSVLQTPKNPGLYCQKT